MRDHAGVAFAHVRFYLLSVFDVLEVFVETNGVDCFLPDNVLLAAARRDDDFFHHNVSSRIVDLICSNSISLPPLILKTN